MEITIEQHTCATHGCGVSFWFAKEFGDRRRTDKQEFFCPNGHSMIYKGETDAQKLVRERQERSEIVGRKNAEIEELQKQLRKTKRKPRAKK